MANSSLLLRLILARILLVGIVAKRWNPFRTMLASESMDCDEFTISVEAVPRDGLGPAAHDPDVLPSGLSFTSGSGAISSTDGTLFSVSTSTTSPNYFLSGFDLDTDVYNWNHQWGLEITGKWSLPQHYHHNSDIKDS